MASVSPGCGRQPGLPSHTLLGELLSPCSALLPWDIAISGCLCSIVLIRACAALASGNSCFVPTRFNALEHLIPRVAGALPRDRLLFAQTLRAYLATEISHPEGWVRGIADPIVGAALSAMHSAPQSSWTLQNLAQEAGCSRAAFARRFSHLMQQSALSYLTSWRMNLAAEYLRERTYTVVEVAGRVGYSTDAFSVAFKRWSGDSPKQFPLELSL